MMLRVGSAEVVSGRQPGRGDAQGHRKRPNSAEVNHYWGRAPLLKGESRRSLRYLKRGRKPTARVPLRRLGCQRSRQPAVAQDARSSSSTEALPTPLARCDATQRGRGDRRHEEPAEGARAATPRFEAYATLTSARKTRTVRVRPSLRGDARSRPMAVVRSGTIVWVSSWAEAERASCAKP
jgi:hypothetical protein